MYIYGVILCFAEKSQNDHFHLRFGAKIQFNFYYTEIGRLISENLLTLAIFVELYANSDQSKMGKNKVYMRVTQEILNISQYHFEFHAFLL